MNPLRSPFLALLALVAVPAHAAVPVADTDAYALRLGGMAQVLVLGQHLDDPESADDRAYLFLKEARLLADGRYGRTTFDLQLAVGGEETVVAPYPGVSLSLLDFAVTTPLGRGDTTKVKIGQFKVPYGREELSVSSELPFAERSVSDLGFRVGRDVGVAVVSRPGLLDVAGGVFTGGGRDVPPAHYLPEKLGIPMLVARVGVGNLDEDPFALDPTPVSVDHTRVGVAVNGLYTRDSGVGHSTLLSVKMADKSLLIDGNWNPYIAAGEEDLGDWWQTGGDVAVRAPVGAWVVAAEAQGDYGRYANDAGAISLAGARAQVDARRGAVEVGARWAMLLPDAGFANGGVAITGTDPIQEIVPSVTWHIAGETARLLLDVPVTLGAPVFVEKDVGAYMGTEMPDQSAILASGGTVRRETVVEGRLMFQAQF